jgi:hypothetical protein
MHAFARFLTLCCLVHPVLAAPPGKPPGQGDIPVVTTMADSAGGWSLRVQSDTQGAYSTTADGKVRSFISRFMPGSDWQLYTYYTVKGGRNPVYAADRFVFFDLSEQVPGSTGAFPSPVGTGDMPAYLVAHGSQAGIDLLSMPTNASALCPGSFRFQAPSGLWYRFSFNNANFPGVDPLKVTCTASDTTGCKVWTVTPGGTTLTGADPNPKNRGRLLQIDAAGNILAVGAEYYLSFSITIAR